MIKIIVIGGPTATGKTRLAIALAKRLDGEVVNADSMQIYKEMKIGTARPSEEETSEVPHHLFAFQSVKDSFSVAEYQRLAREKIADIAERGKTPILIGGTGLYLKSALYDYDFRPEDEVDLSDYADFSNEELFAELQRIDPEAASKTHPHNRKRVWRALEIYRASGVTKTARLSAQKHELLYDCVFVGLTMSRKTLYEKIEERVDKMMAEGLTDEAREVIATAAPSSTSLQAIGYKEFIPYFKKEQDALTTVENIKRNTKRYAKRQYTFFNNQFKVDWYNVETQDFNAIVDDIVDIYENG